MTMGTSGVPNADRRVGSSFPPLFRRLPRARRHRGRSAIDSVDTLWREYFTSTILWNLRDRQSLVGSSQP